MRVHHLNCISTCPLGGKLMDGRTESIVRRGELACHCLKDRASRLHNQRRLRALNRAHSSEVSIFCGHDIREFERLSGQSARVPTGRMARRPQVAPA